MVSNPVLNKVYLATSYPSAIVAVDAATNQVVRTLAVATPPTALWCNPAGTRLYCASDSRDSIGVLDCATDSFVATIPVPSGPVAFCYNPVLNRVYCACRNTGDIAVIDAGADTLIRSVWARGVEPADVCFDSASNRVYAMNVASYTVTAFDCASDSFVAVVQTPGEPSDLVRGPAGKVYCLDRSGALTIITQAGAHAIEVGAGYVLGYDPENQKVYCGLDNSDSVAVVDAVGDSVVAEVRIGDEASVMCYNPAGGSTYAGCFGTAMAAVISGATNGVVATVTFATSHPDLLCYNPTSDRLYCADGASGLVFVIDGNTHEVRAVLPVGGGEIGRLVWNPFRNKAYVSAPNGSAVYVMDGATDSIVARIAVAGRPQTLCYNSANDKVYVAGPDDPSVSAIDCAGDVVVATVQMADGGGELAYNSVSNKVYCLDGYNAALAVIDGGADTVIAVVALPTYSERLCFIPPHNKLYVATARWSSGIYVVDGAGDSLIRTLQPSAWAEFMSYDLGNDRVYATLPGNGRLDVYDPGPDSLAASIWVGYGLSSPLDNGRTGDANRVYCAAGENDVVAVISGTTNAIIRSIDVGDYPAALAWNPAHSWMYVANHGGSSISVLRDTLVVGIEERPTPIAPRTKPGATVVRGVLSVGAFSNQQSAFRAELLDIAGRRVLDLHPGPNDVSHLAPGIYFVREAQAVRKVVVQR
jgi:YVTN family beta-propeller protein